MKIPVLAILAACATPGASAALDATASLPDGSPMAPDAPAMAVDAAPATPPLRAVVIIGQSNAQGIALVSQLAAGFADPNALPYPAVPLYARYGDDLSPQTVHTYSGPLSPLCIGSGDGTMTAGSAGSTCAFGPEFGIELSLGRALDAADPGGWVIGKFTADSTFLADQWWPWSFYCPSGSCGSAADGQLGSASTAPNMYWTYLDWQAAFLSQTGAQLAAVIWIQGEEDAETVPLGARYGAELAAFITASRFDWQNSYGGSAVPFIYGELTNGDLGLPSEPGAALVRAGQTANQHAPQVVMVNQDNLPLFQTVHFTGPDMIALGSAYASAVLSSVGR